ncbi:MAG: hypothetical protein EA417_09075 [Gammaproteobacteria bacterium]|nr:MAG: hypothetical protein EA417_09075 [Gammaproteobacteria bacterium]
MLYALPDHEVMESLLPGIGDRTLTLAEARQALQECPGLVPVAVDPNAGGWVYFADIGDTPLKEWKHIYTIERLAAEGRIEQSFSTELTILEDPLPEPGSVPLHGLIFHVSRCGSTLFSKALARSDRNLMITQGGPLQDGFWAALSSHWRYPPDPSPRNLTMLRNLVALMARRRRPEYERCFVKMISWNTVYLEFFRAAFPDTPALYIYRDPTEVIATILEETTAALRAKGSLQATVMSGLPEADTVDMAPEAYLAHCYAHYFDTVLGYEGDGLSLVNYSDLRMSEAFSRIVEQGFGLDVDAAELAQMQDQYRYYSKDDSNRTPYRGEPEGLETRLDALQRARVRAIVGSRLESLDRSSRNLFPA